MAQLVVHLQQKCMCTASEFGAFASLAGNALSTQLHSMASLVAQFEALITRLDAPFRSLNTLSLSVPSKDDTADNDLLENIPISMMLLPLAQMCPQLQQLKVAGWVGSNLLQQFGSSCPSLTSLEASLVDLSTSTLSNLCSLLPNLTSLSSTWRHGRDTSERHDRRNEAFCLAMKACPRFYSLCTIPEEMTAEIWQELPAQLKTLTCYAPSDSKTWDHAWRQHTSLSSLILERQEGCHNVTIGVLELLLSAAPSLKSVRFNFAVVLEAVFSRADARNLQALEQRMEAGLQLTDSEGSALLGPVGTGTQALPLNFLTCGYTSGGGRGQGRGA